MENMECAVAGQRCNDVAIPNAPPMFWGVAAYTAPRKDPRVTTLMHDMASLTMTTTDQFYIFLWIGVTVIALRPALNSSRTTHFRDGGAHLDVIPSMFERARSRSYTSRPVCLEWAPGVWSPLILFSV